LGSESATLPGKVSGRQHLLSRCDVAEEAAPFGVCIIPAAEASNLFQTLVQCHVVGLGLRESIDLFLALVDLNVHIDVAQLLG